MVNVINYRVNIAKRLPWPTSARLAFASLNKAKFMLAAIITLISFKDRVLFFILFLVLPSILVGYTLFTVLRERIVWRILRVLRL